MDASDVHAQRTAYLGKRGLRLLSLVLQAGEVTELPARVIQVQLELPPLGPKALDLGLQLQVFGMVLRRTRCCYPQGQPNQTTRMALLHHLTGRDPDSARAARYRKHP